MTEVTVGVDVAVLVGVEVLVDVLVGGRRECAG